MVVLSRAFSRACWLYEGSALEAMITLVVLVLLAIPVSIIYLLVRVSALQSKILELQKVVEGRGLSGDVSTDVKPKSPASDPKMDVDAVNASGSLITPLPSHRQLASKPIDVSPSMTDASMSEPVDDLAAAIIPDAEVLSRASSTASFEQPQSHTTQKTSATIATAAPVSSAHRVETTPLDHAVAWLKRYFTEGNLIVRVGILVLFIGVAFLLKYAADNSMLPIELRMAAVALGGIAVLVVGWRLRDKKRDYALVLQGGGIGILYLVAFAALKFFQLLPAGFVFVCLFAMVLLSALLAVVQNARVLAVLAVTGGFLAPVLSSTGNGSHIALFSYFMLLNIGIFAIAWFRSWRILNLVGFAFTFIIGGAWGITSYQPELFISSEFFLILFFLMYVAIALLFAHRQPPNLKGYVDSTLVFGLPIVAFSMQAALVKNYPFILAISACVLGFFYLALAWVYQRGLGKWQADKSLQLLSESFLAVGVVFASLTIPFALDGEWIASAWALEGAAILWVSVRQNRQLGVAFALALQFLGGMGFLGELGRVGQLLPVLNSVYIGALLVTFAGMFSSYYLAYAAHNVSPLLRQLSSLMLVWALAWWLGSGFNEVVTYVSSAYRLSALMLFAALSIALLIFIERRLRWYELRHHATALGAAIIVALYISIQQQTHPFEYLGWLAWPCMFSVLFYYLFLQDIKPLTYQCDDVNHNGVSANTLSAKESKVSVLTYLPWLHMLGLYVGGAVLTWQCIWLARVVFDLHGAWLFVATVLPVLAIVGCVLRWSRWPVQLHCLLYRQLGIQPFILSLVLWIVVGSIFSSGDSAPLMFIPIVNPLDITLIVVLMTVILWWRKYGQWLDSKISSRFTASVFAMIGFMIFNGVILRSLHHFTHLPYTFSAFFDSALTQASLSVAWTLVGLAIMIFASRKGWRSAWIGAAILLGVTVLKLMLLDLHERDALVTIVSFIVVGFLLLIVGYFSPIPPKSITKDSTDKLQSQHGENKDGNVTSEEQI